MSSDTPQQPPAKLNRMSASSPVAQHRTLLKKIEVPFIRHDSSILQSNKSKMTSKTYNFPTIDGHFWVERDGKIIDDDFKTHAYIKNVNKCSGDKMYKEADALTQKVIISMFNRALASHGMTHQQFRDFSISVGFTEPRENSCFQNSVMRLKDGDVLKFGSMGWKRNNSVEIYYEFGGDDWVGAKRFLK